jgi:hypothetical protein
MLLFVRRWIAGLFLAGITALAGFLLRKALERLMAPPQPAPQPQRENNDYSPKPKAGWVPQKPATVTDTLWEGMDRATLLSTFGAPTRREQAADGREIWVYGDRNLSVTLFRGVVRDWADLIANAA